jgi:HAD superfamily hydrolase (TIGR01490 family)
MNLALFDLDHTLLPIDSDHAWGHFTVTLGWRQAHDYAAASDRYYEQYKAGTLDIHEFVAFGTQPLRERDAQTNAQAHARYMAEVIRPAMRPEALALVERHRSSGDTLLLVTATNAFITAPIAQAFGFEHLIAVDLEWDEHGLPTGKIAGTPSFKGGKITRVEQWLSERGLTWADVGRSTFYSDSINDLPLLERVTNPVATNPDDKLLHIANERHWPVLHLFND